MELRYSRKISDNLKIVGAVSMVIDHVGFLFFPEAVFLRVIGRLAFPIFAAGIVSGYQYTSNLGKYVTRLLFFGVISQIPFHFIFSGPELNILFTFAVGLLLVYFFDKKNYLFFGIFALLALFAPIEYGWLGPATVFGFFFFKDRRQLLAIYAVLIFIFLLIKNNPAYLISFYSIFGVLLALYPKFLEKLKAPKLPKYFFYIFYPAHLLLLLLIRLIVN